MKSKRFEVLAARPVNQDGYVQEWAEVGLVAMNSPFDPTPSIKIQNGRIVEMDGKTRDQFDMLDTFIADHAIRLDGAEKAMAMDSLEIARKVVDINVPRDEVLAITLCLTPAKLTEVVGKLTIVEIMMGMTKMRARLMPANQCHVTNVKDNPIQIAADAAEAAIRGFAEMETTVAHLTVQTTSSSSFSSRQTELTQFLREFPEISPVWMFMSGVLKTAET